MEQKYVGFDSNHNHDVSKFVLDRKKTVENITGQKPKTCNSVAVFQCFFHSLCFKLF